MNAMSAGIGVASQSLKIAFAEVLESFAHMLEWEKLLISIWYFYKTLEPSCFRSEKLP